MNKKIEEKLIKEYKFKRVYLEDKSGYWFEKKLKNFNDLKVKFGIDYNWTMTSDLIMIELLPVKALYLRIDPLELQYKFNLSKLSKLLQQWQK